MPDNFYKRLPALTSFDKIFTAASYADAPRDWLAVIVDVTGSTAAVTAGRYKEVNILGASSIIAVLNAVDRMDIPYVFGGDGASFLIPPAIKPQVAQALLGTRFMAEKSFGFPLRVGIVPVENILNAGKKIGVARFAISPSVSMAMFHGDGMNFAEALVKNKETEKDFDVENHVSQQDKNKMPDFKGLECRWQPISNNRGMILSLMILARDSVGKPSTQTYIDAFEKIKGIYPDSSGGTTPVTVDKMNLAKNMQTLFPEITVQSWGRSALKKALIPLSIKLQTNIGRFLLATGRKAGDFDGKNYLQDLVSNTDYRKFDGALRMIIDSSPEQKEKLENFLAEKHAAGDIFYGIHVSDSALMTCIVFDYKQQHLHFVDGNNGGYALAAQQLKKQMAAA